MRPDGELRVEGSLFPGASGGTSVPMLPGAPLGLTKLGGAKLRIGGLVIFGSLRDPEEGMYIDGGILIADVLGIGGN